ncbi:MAG TPA: hypothetical protein VGB37_01105 [Candidatus Lokiarchaeia archaeon]
MNKLKQIDIKFINSILLNDEVSTDKELIKHFIKELGVNKELSKEVVSHRDEALLNPFDFDISEYLKKANASNKVNSNLIDKSNINKDKEHYCNRHKEPFKYTLFGFYCVSCYNENLINLRNKGLI